MTWMKYQLENDGGRKFIIRDHIYAGARFKHNNKKHEFELWNDSWNTEYFDMYEANQEKIIIEIAGHDHW